MITDVSALKRETRYGSPAADKVLYNRHYVLGYSYVFRQAKWALEIVGKDSSGINRYDNFRPDYRIPERFRGDLKAYRGSGFDRGHLISSSNQIGERIQNSETFLLSNMSPQLPEFNRKIWKELEFAIRSLDSQTRILETYVICGPLFYFGIPIVAIGNSGVTIPIPHAFFKSVLTEDKNGYLRMWSFIMENKEADAPLDAFLVSASKIERYAGLDLWSGLTGNKMDREKKRIRKMWIH